MNDEINKPSHYMIFPDMEAIDIIRKTLTPEEFKGYCKGNSLKYRLRAGAKGPAETCIAKAKVYEGWLSSPKPVPDHMAGFGPVEKPWYPDDSGEWVEVEKGSGIPKGLENTDIIEILLDSEREDESWHSHPFEADRSGWRETVAYKKVNP